MSFDLTTLGEYARVQGGYAYKSSDFLGSGTYPVLKIKNVRFGHVDYSESAFIDTELAKETLDWATNEGDILISLTGSGPNAPQSLVGRVARVWGGDPRAWINQRVGRLKLKSEGAIHTDFLFYLLSLPRSQDYLVSNSSGSANQANISGKTVESLPCPKVNYEQSAIIAKVLRDFDEKILINRQLNKTLEEIAQALFKSWFVDFEPTKAKIKAKRSSQCPPLPPGEGPGVRAPLPPDLLNNARRLRQQLTDAERLLWQLLRGRQLAGCKFRRQHPIGNFILDFYCHDKQLAVELDGGQHNDPNQREADERRTAWLAEQGIKVLRFWNNEVLQETEGVLEEIFRHLTGPHPRPLSRGERGEAVVADFVERVAMCAISGKTDDELDRLSAEQFAQLRDTAALFPDELVESELGMIPEGWAWKSLDAIAHYQNGLALQKYRPKDNFDFLPIVKIAQLKAGVATSEEKASPDINPACIIDNGDVVFSWSGSLMVDIWCGGKAALNQHLFKVTSEAYPKWFYYHWTQYHLAKFQQIAADKAVTMGHIKREHLHEAMCAVPNFDSNELRILAQVVERQVAARLENNSLAQLRDTLLPQLLYGEISLSKEVA